MRGPAPVRPPPVGSEAPERNPTLTAEAHVETERPSRYLVQLCRHVSLLPARPVGDSQAGPDVPHAEWSDTHGIVTLAPWGQCTMDASTDTLTVRVEATDEDKLQRIQDLVAERLTRYGRRDQLTVTWQRPPPPAVQRRDADSAATRAQPKELEHLEGTAGRSSSP